MPKLGYKETEEHKRKIGEAHKGIKFTEEHKKKLGEAHMGDKNHNFGKKLTEETKQKMSKAHKKNPIKYWLDKKFTKEHKNNLSLSRIGKKGYWAGKKRPETTGENNSAWKGGITSIHTKIRMSLEYRLWRKSVFERDNYTCIWCGQVGGKLQVDHIKPFADYPELRFAIDNGRTLCENCHKTTNSYGVHRKDILW